MTAVRVEGSREDLALAGLPGDPRDGAPLVVLGSAPLPDGAPAPAVRWLAHPASGAPAGERIIATGGDGLWRRAPWPVADALFDLPPAEGARVLVAGGDEASRGEVLERLRGLGVEAAGAERLTVDGLAAASVVVLRAPDPRGPLPGEAMAVLAARRVLVCDRCEPAFGLLAEFDWFPGEDADQLAALADSALAYADAFERARTLGALAARRHRASVVYERLAADLALEAGSD